MQLVRRAWQRSRANELDAVGVQSFYKDCAAIRLAAKIHRDQFMVQAGKAETCGGSLMSRFGRRTTRRHCRFS
jgi:hypothetical protein